MNGSPLVEQLFQAALEKPASERDAYLAVACQGDEALRQEVSSLLIHYQKASSFLDSRFQLLHDPFASDKGHMDPVAAGKIISHYRVLQRLGGGGMGVVHVAEDMKLGRRVAMKFLPAEMGRDQEFLARFEREARSASALDHPNICPIYEFGEHESQPFIAMPLLEGQTLREYIDGGSVPPEDSKLQPCHSAPMPLSRALDFSLQVLSGLEAAHKKGIIHRDIKPANLFVTEQGVIKILDFGLAKIQEAHSDEHSSTEAHSGSSASVGGSRISFGDLSLTTTGTMMGTAAYMSPEQMRGEKLDARTDIFSVGMVLYEMATGKHAFQGKTAIEVRNAILDAVPIPAWEPKPGMPLKLQQIINKALEKDRGKRYQSAAAMMADLESLRAEMVSAPQRRRRIAAILCLAVAAIAVFYLYYQQQRRRHLTEKDKILLAGIANKTGENVFQLTTRQALRAEFEQSPFLNMLSDDQARRQLQKMDRPTDTPLVGEVARDVCLGTGSKAMLGGSITKLNGQYVIALNAENCQDLQSLAYVEERAPSQQGILDALNKAASEIRWKLGESLASIRSFDTPIRQATTSSLEALEDYSAGLEAQDKIGDAAGIPLFKRATGLDPNFALAYAALAVTYGNLAEYSQARENLQKAFDLRGHTSTIERLRIEAFYFSGVTGELEKGNAVYESWIRSYPKDHLAPSNLAGNYNTLGRYEEAANQARNSIRLGGGAVNYTNLVNIYAELGRTQEARAAYEEAIARKMDRNDLHLILYSVAFLEGDRAEMERQVTFAAGKGDIEDSMLSSESDSEAFYGRLQAARVLSERAEQAAEHNDRKETSALWMMNDALREAEFGNGVRARKEAKVALAIAPTQAVKTVAALTLARAGDSPAAESIAAEIARQSPLDTMLNGYWLPSIYATVDISRHQPEKAIAKLRVAVPYELGTPPPGLEAGAFIYPAYIRGQAYLALGKGPEAAAEFQKLLDHPGVLVNCPLRPLAYLGLGRAYALERATGGALQPKEKKLPVVASADPSAKARTAYDSFFALWQGADRNIPVLQEAKVESRQLK